MRVPPGTDEAKAHLVVRVTGPGLDPVSVSVPVADLKHDPADAGTFAGMAREAAGADDHARAEKIYAAGVAAHLDDATLHNEFAWYLLTRVPASIRDPARALPLARRAVELSGREEGYILDTLAVALHDSGDLEGAVREAAAAARLCPDHEGITERARVYAGELAARHENQAPATEENP